MDRAAQNCPFCHPDAVLFGNELVYVKPDKFPVSPDHLLIIPKRHVADFFLTSEAEKIALLAVLDKARCFLEKSHAPVGYNIGINVGDAAGLTMFYVRLPAEYGVINGDADQ